MNEEIFISSLVFASLALFCVGGYYYYAYLKSRQGIIEKIRQQGTTVDDSMTSPEEESDESKTTIKSATLRLIATLGNMEIAKPHDDPSQLSLAFQQAGYHSKKASMIYYGTKVLLGICFFTIFILLKIIIPIRVDYNYFLILALVSCVVGYYLPSVLLKARIANRKERLQNGFPDALDLLVVCVEAGASLDSAILRVGEEIRLNHADLSDEFQLLHLELKAGRTRRSALKELARRTGLEDVSTLVNMIIQSERFGTGIAEALRIHSDFMRVKRYQKAEELGAKLPVKITIPLILFIFPALLIVILGPAAIRIMHTLLAR